MNTSFQALIDDFEKYKTTKTDTHSGDLLEHSVWTAFYVNDLFTNLDMNNPLHRVWNSVIVDDLEDEDKGDLDHIDLKKILIISAFLHDIGKGGDGATQYYEKPDHENIGAEYIDKGEYKTIDGNIIDIKKMFKDFKLSKTEIEIIKILIQGHLLLGRFIDKRDGYKDFVEELNVKYENSSIEYNKYLLAAIVMMQLIICIADVMAMKEYKGNTKSIVGYRQLTPMKAPHDSSTDVFKDYNYERVIDSFVPEAYGYVFDTYIKSKTPAQQPVKNPLEDVLQTLDTIGLEEFQKIIDDINMNDVNEDTLNELIEGCVSLKRFDILSVMIIIPGTDAIRTSLNELLDNSLLDSFISYVEGSTDLKPSLRSSIFNDLLNYIIENSISEGIIPFITTHKNLIGIIQLNTAKRVYKEAIQSGNNTFEAKQIYNEIRGIYTVPEGFYKSDKHRLYCEDIDTVEIPEPLIVDSKKIIFEIPSIIRRFKIGYLNDVSMANQTIELNFEIKKDNYGGGISDLFGDDFTLDSDWVYKSIKYINDLPIEDKFTIFGYTHNGDELVNNFLLGNNPKLKSLIDDYYYGEKSNKYKNWFLPIFFQMINLIKNKKDIFNTKVDKLTLPKLRTFIKNSVLTETYEHILTKLKLFSYDFYIDCIRLYAEDLKRIINNSPAMTKTSILYRGVKDKYYYPDPSNKLFKSTTFMSTSYNPESAYEFSSVGCCFKKIIAKPGTRGLFIEAMTSHPGEFEVLLSAESKFIIIDDKIKNYSYSEKRSFKDICSEDSKPMNITTMEIIL